MTPENPLVGGTILRRPAIQSPNFVQSPLQGWSIDANGNAYFANVTAQGNITTNTVVIEGSTGSVLVYSGTPGSGNLIASIAATGGTDAFGNAYVGGITAYSGANVWASLTAGTMSLQGAAGQDQTGQVGTSGSGTTFLSSGLQTGADTGAEVIAESAAAAGGSSTITLSATIVETTNGLAVAGALTVGGVNIVTALSGAATTTNGLTDGTIAGSSSTAGLPNGGINGTSGGASAGTAHTHGAGSFAVISGQHSHAAGSYAVNNGTHSHDLPTI